MLINTHFIISKSILKNLEDKKAFFISDKNFIYGNIKPDISSKYVLDKHYLEESLSMILEKIKNLCKLTLDSLKKYFSISKLSQELGVICHFLCDFFCAAHSERWRFTHSMDTMSKHVAYENKIHDDIEEFFYRLYSTYKECDISFENDLKFSSHACTTIVNHIIDSILVNTANSYKFENCV